MSDATVNDLQPKASEVALGLIDCLTAFDSTHVSSEVPVRNSISLPHLPPIVRLATSIKDIPASEIRSSACNGPSRNSKADAILCKIIFIDARV